MYDGNNGASTTKSQVRCMNVYRTLDGVHTLTCPVIKQNTYILSPHIQKEMRQTEEARIEKDGPNEHSTHTY